MLSQPDFKAFFQASPTACLILAPDDPHFTILAANDSYLQSIGGMPESKVVGRPYADAMQEAGGLSDCCGLSTSVRKVIQAGAMHQQHAQRCVMTRPDGTVVERYLDLEYTPIREGEDIKYILQTARDITERVNAETGQKEERRISEALRVRQEKSDKMVADLKRSNTSLEEFAYVASHDLQEPLRKINAFGDMLQARHADGLGASGMVLLQRMQSAASRMRTLIDDLLTYSRLSTRPTGLVRTDASTILQEVLNDLETAVRDAGAVIEWEGMEPVMGDALQLRQLFQNLLSNALKFAAPDRNPVVRIAGKREKGADAGFPASSEEAAQEYLRLDIADNGIGFEPQYADRIFQIFQRLHGRTEVPGTGVGLSIVQKVVENHHGRIAVNAVPGVGATFTVWLPLAAEMS